MSAQQFDPFELPLQGQQLIEASAGTGKTFSLAGLYLRLIIERNASVRDILVMTFTKAATQELRDRIRRRLEAAARIAANRNAATPGDPEHKFVCEVLDRADDTPQAMTRRLRTAATEVDEATIVTIHGFAQRATRDHAFDSALAFDRGDNIDDRTVFAEAAADFWRSAIYGHNAQPALLEIWPTPEALTKAIKPILDRPGILIDGDRPDTLRQALATLESYWRDGAEQLTAALGNAVEHGAFKNSGMKTLIAGYETAAALVGSLDQRLQRAFADGEPPVLPDAIEELGSTGKFISGGSNAKKACAEPFKTIDALAPLAALVPVARVARIATTARTIRGMAETRKREHRQFSYDDLVRDLHAALTHPEQGPRLAAELRAQSPYALVDEFQDTDPLQYDCLQRIYLDTPDDADPAATALLLIGDPKQAIYAFRGGDIYAYLAAARAAQNNKYTLNRNYRSTAPVLRAIAALFEWPADKPFLEQGIDFPPISADAQPRQPVRRGDDGEPAPHPALTVWQFTGGEGTKTADDTHIVRRTVAAIAALLAGETVWDRPDANDGSTAIRPQDIAVLVNSNYQAATIQAALAHHGIAAVCQRRDSVFATEQAAELALLLAAMAEPDNQTAVRSAETTLLAGSSLCDIIALADTDNAMQACIARYQQHFGNWQRRGVLAALEPLFAAAAPRILTLADGERRMSNYLQLGERLAVAETESYGMNSLRHWLDREIQATAEDDNSNEEAQLRLESDDALVRIATLHSAKGLEYPIVLMPYAMYLGAPSMHRNPEKPPHVYHAPGSDAPDQVHIDLTGTSEGAKQRAVLEAQSESLRLLYVGLTRAAAALFISWREPGDGESSAAGNGSKGSALDNLLGRDGRVIDAFTAIAEQQPETVAIESINVDEASPAIDATVQHATTPLGNGRTDLPTARPRWSTYSFSRLAHAAPETQAAELPEPGADDERTDVGSDVRLAEGGELPPLDKRLSGVRFGSAVHDMLETWLGDPARSPWPAPGQPCSADQRRLVASRLRNYGLIGSDDNDSRVDDSAGLIARTLHAPLPEIGPLAALDTQRLRTEMGFMLRLGGNRLGALVGTLEDAGYLNAALGGHPAQTLYGLMQGFIDLVAEVDGRYYVLDYKTNRLGDTPAAYNPAGLQQAISRAHYDLQYLIYSVALHRHLGRSLGNAYDPATHLGGVQYLFVRAMDGATTAGVFTDRPEPALIETLDALFDSNAESKAALSVSEQQP